MRPPTPVDKFLPGKRIKQLAITVFADSLFWYKYWHCHRLPERSFSVLNRQLHICSRCTGVALGMALAPISILIPTEYRLFFFIGTAAFLVDGLTQLIGLRKSTNLIRFLTGVLFPLAFTGVLLAFLT